MASPRNYYLVRCLSLCFLIILMSFANAASFQYYQVPQQEQEYRMKALQRLASPDMLKALEYIENLRKQGSRTEGPPDYTSYQGAPLVPEHKGLPVIAMDKPIVKDDESDWMKTMWEALMQAEKESKVTPQDKSKSFSNLMDKNLPPELLEDYDSNKWSEKRPKSNKFPLGLFDDYSRDNPLKRTNEIVEGQYTPQSLATLQSVFQELGKLKGQTNHKRDRLEEDQKLYRDDEDDMYKANNIAYEDVAGGEEWNPIEEKVESQTQEELKESKEEVEKTDEMDEEMKRSGLLGLQDEEPEKENKEQESDNLSKLMNSYLKMWLNQLEKGKQNTEKRTVMLPGKNPDTFYQIVQLSRKLQIPPEDLIDMLQDEDSRKFAGRLEADKEVEVPEDLDEVSETMTDKTDVYKSKQGFIRQPTTAVLPSGPEDLTVEDMMNLMGTEKLQNQKYPLLNRISLMNGLPRPYSTLLIDPKAHKVTWSNDLEKRQIEYEPRSDKAEDFGDYIFKILAKFPELLGNNQNKKIPALYSPGDIQDLERQYEKGLRGYLNMQGYQDLETGANGNRRLPLPRETDDTQNKQYTDEDMLMKVLEFMNQEKTEKGRDYSVKRAMEYM